MGNYKFRLSYMMRYSWLYKPEGRKSSTRGQRAPKESNPPSNPIPQPKHQPFLPNRPSCYFPSRVQPRENSPRKSPEKTRKKAADPSPESLSSVSRSHQPDNSSSSIDDFDVTLSFHHLPRILTKPAIKEAESKAEFDCKRVMLKRAQKGLHRIKVKPSSPKLEIKKVHANANRSQKMVNCKSLLESFVVVMKTSDPEGEFRDSMVEMIIENGIWNLKDLEELLACYLLLNSDKYHDVILKVFEDIWVSLREVSMG